MAEHPPTSVLINPKLAYSSPGNLAGVFRQRAADLRKNASGGDDFDPKSANFCADVLDSYADEIEKPKAFTETDDLLEDLRWLKARVRNCRGAIESGQMTDKDVHGGLLRVGERIDQIIFRLGRSASVGAPLPSPETNR